MKLRTKYTISRKNARKLGIHLLFLLCSIFAFPNYTLVISGLWLLYIYDQQQDKKELENLDVEQENEV